MRLAEEKMSILLFELYVTRTRDEVEKDAICQLIENNLAFLRSL